MSERSDNPINRTPADRQAGRGTPQYRRISSTELFGVLREVVIEHVGHEYRLRITQQGKLILTK